MLKYLLFALSLFAGLPASTLATELHGRVIAVLDGDTIAILASGNKGHRIRLAGIDAPEKSQAYGQVAKRSLSDKVFGKDVRVVAVDRDRYERIVGRVFTGIDVNRAMVAEGYAWVYRQYAGSLGVDRVRFEAAEEAARAARAGLWRDPTPVPPWEYRRSAASR